MSSLLVVLVVAALCVTWVQASRRSRLRWLVKLDLPGHWAWQDHSGSLELSGNLDAGRYRFVEAGHEEQGSWSLRGHELALRPDDGGAESALDVRLFAEGKIGIHGPGREGRIYVKQRGNVVPLRRPA
jgi:hypothetical protein